MAAGVINYDHVELLM